MEFIQLTGLPALTPEEELVITSELAQIIWQTPPFVYHGIQVQIIRSERIIFGINDVCILVEIKNLTMDRSQTDEARQLCRVILQTLQFRLAKITSMKSLSLAITVMVYCPWGEIIVQEGQWASASFLST